MKQIIRSLTLHSSSESCINCDKSGLCFLVFVKTPYDPNKPSIEAVLDSSRYFVVRVEEAGKKAFIGMGFAERTDSFDFSACFMIQLEPIGRELTTKQMSRYKITLSEAENDHVSVTLLTDY